MEQNSAIAVANATFCATLVDQWILNGLAAAFVAPGSRSTPLAVALAERPEIRLEVFHDERSASFAALGYGQATMRPAVVLCTSGTAATHFHGAVAEAGTTRIPMLVCTANRPPELWGIGAPQTIDQRNLYAASVNAYFEPGPPDQTDPGDWRPLANSAWLAALGRAEPGPVQIDQSFREPLAGLATDLPPALAPAEPTAPLSPSPAQLAAVADHLFTHDGSIRPGVIVAGRGESDSADLVDLAAALGWPVLADHRSGLRTGVALRWADTLLRHNSDLKAATTRVLRFGEPLSSKVLSHWIGQVGGSPGGLVYQFAPWGRIIDPERVAHQVPEHGAAQGLAAEVRRRGGSANSAWLQEWSEVSRSLGEKVAQVLTDSPSPNEPSIAAGALMAVPTGGALVVASSMPVRDIEWFGPDRDAVSVYSNRGANGIDGVLATAIGIATTGVPTVCLLGDIAFLHDASSLTALARRQIDLTVVVVDNDGGGIFSALPQYSLLPKERYEQLFGTPHGTNIQALAAAHNLPVAPLPEDPSLMAPDGVKVFVAQTRREDSLALRNLIATLRP